MTHPEADPADLAEQAAGESAVPAPAGVPDDAPEADVLEQAAVAGPGSHRVRDDAPLEADELDAAEQAVTYDQDEDEHR